MTDPLPASAPPRFHLLAKPSGSTCNIDCKYCFFLSNGGCPKDRFALSRDGDLGHKYLCAGLELFFTHTCPAMQTMAQLLQRGRPPSEVMALTAAEDAKRRRNQPCPCESGRRFHSCHGDNAPLSPFTGLTLAPIPRAMGRFCPCKLIPCPSLGLPVQEASV